MLDNIRFRELSELFNYRKNSINGYHYRQNRW